VAGVPRISDPAPDFAGKADGRVVRLSDYRGRYLVLYFFPKAFTPGCTKESIRFRDNYDEIRELGGDVVGVSTDDLATQCNFAQELRVKFPIIADDDASISRAYGVRRSLFPVVRRVTFVIDPRGRIAARFDHEFQISKHLDDVLHFLRQNSARAASQSR
jgi:peroxiredoxin